MNDVYLIILLVALWLLWIYIQFIRPGKRVKVAKIKNINNLKVGDRVRINENCVTDYVGIVGTILDINELTMDGDFIFHIKFDMPMASGLDNEYFAPNEVDLIGEEKNEKEV